MLELVVGLLLLCCSYFFIVACGVHYIERRKNTLLVGTNLPVVFVVRYI